MSLWLLLVACWRLVIVVPLMSRSLSYNRRADYANVVHAIVVLPAIPPQQPVVHCTNLWLYHMDILNVRVCSNLVKDACSMLSMIWMVWGKLCQHRCMYNSCVNLDGQWIRLFIGLKLAIDHKFERDVSGKCVKSLLLPEHVNGTHVSTHVAQSWFIVYS